jgi:flagellar biogenesis protein FliO
MDIFAYTIAGVTGINRTNDTMFTIKYVVVVTVFLFLLWGVSRYLTRRQHLTFKEKNIKIVERVALSNDKYLYLIELDQVHYLISSDKSGMSLIDKREHLKIESIQRQVPQSGAFFEQLKTSILKRESNNNSKDEQND